MIWGPALRIEQVVVTPPLKRWETMQALALVYRDATSASWWTVSGEVAGICEAGREAREKLCRERTGAGERSAATGGTACARQRRRARRVAEHSMRAWPG